MTDKEYPRLLQFNLEEALEDTPVVLIHGPRQCGKTTLAQKVGEQRGYTYLSFDDVNLVSAARTDPIGFVERLNEPVILDEVQRVPELFSSIKYSIDQNRKPGRFLLTGSANVLLLPKLSDSLAGRLEIINLRPLARCEIEGTGAGLLPRLLKEDFKFSCEGRLGEKLAPLIVAGGYPEPLQRKSAHRKNKWYQNYVNTLIQRDIREFSYISNLDAIPKILQMAATQSAQLLNMINISTPFQISRATVSSYFTLLQNIFLVDLLPAWHNNKGKRLIKKPKVHLTDSGLASVLLKVRADQLDADRSLLGQLLENFVYNELRRQASWIDGTLDFYHFRDKDQQEVDIVIEETGGRIIAVEVKAAATIMKRDFRGLQKLRATVGDDWKVGILLYDGDMILPFGPQMWAVPISALWCK